MALNPSHESTLANYLVAGMASVLAASGTRRCAEPLAVTAVRIDGTHGKLGFTVETAHNHVADYVSAAIIAVCRSGAGFPHT